MFISVEYKQIPQPDAKLVVSNYAPFIATANVSNLLKSMGTQSVGEALAGAGFAPFYPIMIIPGLASSALECWETPKSAWLRERVWVDPLKIGSPAFAAKFTKTINSFKKTKPAVPSGDDDMNNFDADQRIWLRHMLTAPDGFSDPPGIKVRPCVGLAAIDYLATSALPMARPKSYVFAHVIAELCKVGYTTRNLDAAPVSFIHSSNFFYYVIIINNQYLFSL